MNEIKVIDDTLFFNCPHCSQEILVILKELNCKIFRCGIRKDNYKQIDPHLSKNECDKLVSLGLIFGCSRPIEIIIQNGKYFVTICEYK